MTFPQTIKLVRESLQLTQAEFAHKLGISSQTVNNWETGRVEPWPRKKQILLESLGVVVPSTAAFTLAQAANHTPHAKLGVAAAPRRSRPNVCREIQGEDPPQVERVPQAIEIRRPPPHD
jgi:transcriptional regulator with XRE-family HTH domain